MELERKSRFSDLSATENNQSVLKESLEALGLLSPVKGGIQINLNAAKMLLPDGGFVDKSACDHNCTAEHGGYECPAAITLNRGLKFNKMASSEYLLEGIKRTVDGITEANRSFVDKGMLDEYCTNFNVPVEVGVLIEDMLNSDSVEINLFGGNPELHPEIINILGALDKEDYNVNLTTTGARAMRDENFVDAIKSSSLKVLALSADDFESPSHVSELSRLSLGDIKEKRAATPFLHGQKRKAFEAVYVAKLANENPDFPKILFNMVIHPGNLDVIDETVGALQQNFPGVTVNPYPAQSAFRHGKSIFEIEHASKLEGIVDKMIDAHFDAEKDSVPRLHYWLMLKSVFETFGGDSEKTVKAISGYGVWKCYKSPGAGSYVQIGSSTKIKDTNEIPGGHLACFWNEETVTTHSQVWDMSSQEVASYINGGMGELAGNAKNPCAGCLMPRLTSGMRETELGMSEEIIPRYLKLRKEHVGF